MKKLTAIAAAIAAAALLTTSANANSCSSHETSAKTIGHEELGNIVETANAAGSFKTLVAAVKAAGLVETLIGDGPFTVFAPTDEAFAKLPAGTVESLLKPENKEKLQAILTYHVVAGAVTAADVVKLHSAKSVQGQRIDIEVVEDKVMVDQAQVLQTDILTSNGVIHVIDSVILPKPSTDTSQIL